MIDAEAFKWLLAEKFLRSDIHVLVDALEVHNTIKVKRKIVKSYFQNEVIRLCSASNSRIYN